LLPTSIETVLADENYLGRIIDYGISAPRIAQLYRHAAEDLGEPRVAELCTDNYPVYAWPYEQRHVWRTDRSPIAIALVRAVVGRPPRTHPGP
jgi:IS1 family transposase